MDEKLDCSLQVAKKEFYGKLKNIIKELPEDFLVIHKSYVVNKQRIARYTYETVELDNGRVLTISQAQRNRSEKNC